jgi:hypothetical protein
MEEFQAPAQGEAEFNVVKVFSAAIGKPAGKQSYETYLTYSLCQDICECLVCGLVVCWRSIWPVNDLTTSGVLGRVPLHLEKCSKQFCMP